MSSVVTTQPYYTKIIAPYKLLIGYVRYIQISLTWLRDIQGKMANSLSFFWVVIPNTNIEPRNHVRIMIYWTWPKMRKQWLFTFRQLVVSERKIIQQTKPLITRYRLDHCSYRWVIRFIARQGLKILRWFCAQWPHGWFMCSTPDRSVQVRALAGEIELYSLARLFNFLLQCFFPARCKP